MRRSNGEEYEEEGAWLLVDGGYHKWRCLQCPLKHSALAQEKLWSEWAETVRKDVECVFGVLKGRFLNYLFIIMTKIILITCFIAVAYYTISYCILMV